MQIVLWAVYQGGRDQNDIIAKQGDLVLTRSNLTICGDTSKTFGMLNKRKYTLVGEQRDNKL